MLSLTIFDINVSFAADNDLWESCVERIQREGHFVIEYRHRTKGGEVFPVEAMLNYYELEDKWLFVSSVRDITERKAAEEALRVSEEHYRLLYDNAGEAIFSYDPELRLTEINRVGCEAIGYSREEVLGKNVLELNILHPRDLELAATVISRLFAGENVLKTEYTVIRKDGSERLFSVVGAAIRDPDGNLQSIINMCRDITERKAAEEDVKGQREILQGIFDNIPVMVTYFDENGKIQMVSREVVETLGWTFEEWKTGNILAKCYPEPEVFKEVLDFMVSGSTRWKDFKTTTKQGTVIDTAWTNISLPDGVSMGIGQDITERKQAEEALRQSEEKFREFAENLPEVVFEADGMGKLLYVNSNALDVFGYTEEELYSGSSNVLAERVNDFETHA
jgi:PAS domain S-box-containing protein